MPAGSMAPMIDISVKINGREVRPSDMRTDLERALMDNTIRVMQDAARYRCPAHRRTALRITANGLSLSQLDFSVDGCCRILEGVLEETLEQL